MAQTTNQKSAISRRSKRYYEKHGPAIQARKKLRRVADRPRYRAQEAKARYKYLHLEPAYDAPERCECCGADFLLTVGGAHFDHCHLTGLFRGWLCKKCNVAFGMAGDSPEGVRQLLRYAETAYANLQRRLKK